MSSHSEDAPELDHLISALAADHGPPGPASGAVRAAARAAFAMRCDDAVMTDIGADSLTGPPPGVRSPAAFADTPRYLRFDAPGTAIGLEVTVVDDNHRTLVGSIDPPGPTTAEIRTPQGTASAPIDDNGAFVISGVPGGPVSLVLHHPADRPVATPWLAL
ncbi:hypothetical protein GCM10027570_21270 [Streptomonospora sediminis]